MENYDENKLRKLAERRVKEKRDLTTHIITFVCVNGFLIGIYLLTNNRGFFWPAFPILGWGIGLVIHITSTINFLMDKGDRVEKELEKLTKRMK